ncbi:MAG: SDR family NAD(P)-dependent oxidoreductase [Ignavibacterium sp.]
MNLLKNKIAFITGASSGIGKATAEIFAEEGANLILNARREDRILKFVKELKEKYNVETLPLIFDVRNYNSVKTKINSLPNNWKNIDILVNNAGLARGLDKIYEGSINDWEEMIDTNIKGLLYITREILPLMVKNSKGHIMNIGSTAGHDVYPNGNVYCATKFAEKALSQAIRIDSLDKKIKVTSIDPGMVETEFSTVRFHNDTERAKKVYENVSPLKPEDIAEIILFAVSRPYHVNINQVIVTPINQANSNFTFRE